MTEMRMLPLELIHKTLSDRAELNKLKSQSDRVYLRHDSASPLVDFDACSGTPHAPNSSEDGCFAEFHGNERPCRLTAS